MLSNMDWLPIIYVVLESTVSILACIYWWCSVVLNNLFYIFIYLFSLDHNHEFILLFFGWQCCRYLCVQNGHWVFQSSYQNNDAFRVLDLSEYVMFHILSEFIVLVFGFYLLGPGPQDRFKTIYLSLEFPNWGHVCWVVESPTSSSTSLVNSPSSTTALDFSSALSLEYVSWTWFTCGFMTLVGCCITAPTNSSCGCWRCLFLWGHEVSFLNNFELTLLLSFRAGHIPVRLWVANDTVMVVKV